MPNGAVSQHRLWAVVSQRSREFQRRVSLYRTPSGIFVEIIVYHDGDEPPWAVVTVNRANVEVELEESYTLKADGSGSIRALGFVRSTTGAMKHRIDSESAFRHDEIFNAGSPWIRAQLDQLATWLDDPGTVRVNPYHPEIILGEEDAPVDEFLRRSTAALDAFGRALGTIEAS